MSDWFLFGAAVGALIVGFCWALQLNKSSDNWQREAEEWRDKHVATIEATCKHWEAKTGFHDEPKDVDS